MKALSEQSNKSMTHRLTMLYIVALGLTGLLAIVDEVFVRRALVDQSHDERVINDAGQQRMLSQKLSKTALAIETSADPTQRARRVARLRDVAALLERSHEGLQHGSPELGLPGHNSPETEKLFAEIEPEFQTMLAATKELVALETSGDSDSAHRTSHAPISAKILSAEPSFLKGMDQIVTQYEKEASAATLQRKRIRYVLLGITLLVLLLEALFIFRPATRKIDQSITRLVEAQRTLEQKTALANLLQTIAVAANESATVEEALQVSLDRVCAHTGWPIGDAYLLDKSTQELVPTKLWHLNETEGFEIFRRVTDNTRFSLGVGLPGRILASGKPAWVMDVTTDPNFPHAKQAQDIGVRAGFGFPLMISAEVLGVLEFFSAEPIEPDEELLETMAHVGTQLGRVIERKRAEEEIRVKTSALENAAEGIARLDTEGKYVSVNQAYAGIIGYTPEEMIGMEWPVTVHVEDRERLQVTYQRMLDEDKVEVEARGVRKDGSIFHKLLVMVAIYNQQQEYAGHFCFMKDITARKRAEKELKNSEMQLAEAQHIAHVGSWEWDVLADEVHWSDELHRIFGVQPQEFGATYEAYLTFIHPDDRKLVESGVEKALQGKVFPSFENRIIRPDGTVRVLQANGRVLADEAGHVVKIVGTAHDITERKRMEIDLEQARDVALESSRLKSEFLANMSHEIRTPLNGVMGMLALLIATGLSKHQLELADASRSSAESLLAIINDILDFSKIEAGRLEIESIPFDLRAVVEEVVSIVALRAEEKGLDLIVRFSPSTPRYVVGDPGRIRQCLLNLLSNAIKFTQRGHVFLEVQAEERQGNQASFQFSVSDTGIGVPSDQLDHIFGRFTQIDASTTRKFGGTGLGLAITKKLVEILGGTSGVSSETGKGSTFWFNLTLPLDVNAQTPAGPTSLAEVRIMVVSDNETNRRVLHEQVISWGMRNGSCRSGAQAFLRLRAESAARDPYQIVLIDYQMPEINGLALGRLIKADATLEPTKLVLLTSVRSQANIERAKRAGFAAYLTKPVRQSQLMDTLVNIWRPQSEAASTDIVEDTAPKHALGPAQPELLTARVLVVDDNAINQRVAQLALERLGCRVDLAGDGKQAVEMTRLLPYDVVFMDCEMPTMDGFEASAEIRRQQMGSRRIPIVAMTARALQGDRQKCLAAGMDDYISKPVRLSEFSRTVRRWAGIRGQNRLLQENDAPKSGTKSAPAFGLNALARLRALIPDEASLAELFDAFIDQARELISEMYTAARNDQPSELQRLAHKLNGASANLGASPMSEICKHLDEKGRAQNLQGATELVSQLEKEFARVDSLLSRFAQPERVRARQE
jgi:PAS domain S-box-containing protein